MAATAPLKKSPYMKELTAQGDPPKEANTVEKMNGQLISSLQIKRRTILKNGRLQVVFWKKYIVFTTHYFKEWTTASCVLKKIYCL